MPPPDPRLRWADVAKGACIVLVVMHHVTVKHYPGTVPAELGAVADAWVSLSGHLKPVRMPLFFVISGLFASRAVSRPWTGLARRVASTYYLYAVWLVLLAVLLGGQEVVVMNRTRGAGELVSDLAYASTGLWFLYALSVYVLVARLTRRVPPVLLLGAASALAACVSLLPVSGANRESVLLHLVYFLLGARAPALVRRLGEGLLPGRVLLASYVGLVIVLGDLGLPRSAEVVALSVLGVPLGLRLAARLEAVRPAAVPLAWLGRRTLPVYVLHMPLLVLLAQIVRGPLVLPGPWGAALALAYPVLAASLIVAGCLLLHRLLVRAGGGFLFALPERLLPARLAAERPHRPTSADPAADGPDRPASLPAAA